MKKYVIMAEIGGVKGVDKILARFIYNSFIIEPMIDWTEGEMHLEGTLYEDSITDVAEVISSFVEDMAEEKGGDPGITLNVLEIRRWSALYHKRVES